MRHLLEQWADDLYLHGHDLARWITDYVDLEESMAVGSMAQEELAHAAALLALTGTTVEDRDWRIYGRPVTEWWPATLVSHPTTEWPDTVARAFLFTEATGTLVDRLRRSDDYTVARTASVIQAEQDLHARHWHRWVRILARDRKTGDEFQRALAGRVALTPDIFGEAPDVEANTDVLDSLHTEWCRRVRSALLALGVEEVDLPDRSEPRRRATEGSELDRTLDTLRVVRAANPEWRYEIFN